MLAQRLVREQLLTDEAGNTFGVKSIRMQCFMGTYDHKRQKALREAGKYKLTAELPVWQWVIVRGDNRCFRFRCGWNKQYKFEFAEWTEGSQIDSPGPPSTGAGRDSHRPTDGPGYFRSTESHYSGHGETKAAGKGSASSSAGGTGTSGGGQPRGSGGDGPGRHNTPGSGSVGLGNGRGYRTDPENATVGQGPQPPQQVAGSGQALNLGEWSSWGRVGSTSWEPCEWTRCGQVHNWGRGY